MATFRPPTDNLVYWSEPGDWGIFTALRPGRRGRNVFKLTDGTFVEWQPAFPDQIAHIYHGGHVHELTEQEEADLRAAGYGDYIEA